MGINYLNNEKFKVELTGIAEGDKSRALEVTIPVVPAMHLIISIHGVRSMCEKPIGLITIPTLIYLPAVHTTRSAAKVQHRLKNLFVSMWLSHAPNRWTPHHSAGDSLSEPKCPSIVAAKIAAQIHIVNLRPVTIEEPKISLRRTPLLLVLVEQSKHKHLNLVFGLHGCAFVGLGAFDQSRVVSLRIFRRGRDVTGITLRRPPRLRYGDFH